MGKFVISTRKDGKFQFNLHAQNGQIILTSQAYAAKAGCINGIESVQTNAADSAQFEKLTAKDGSPYFTLKATNGQVIGNSQMYSSESARDNGIASVQNNAPSATIDDQSE
ncbi:YegP family protein [Ostreibacterium oceani]|uniref:DUF1508 domain-containing protein n=1 Tax=Ostreibacterium oceani TaxID=2654998 RepID=A0A6N7ETU2_9GAMM|nr:YegP family protein [Ostreibacterium oceani]MPV85842.1 DUF1508 domain-containing protein [Ostreibacterium oceani]